jgi:hypothetical protein
MQRRMRGLNLFFRRALLGSVWLVSSRPVLAQTAADESGEGVVTSIDPPIVAGCVRDHDSAQMLRLHENWADARQAMQRCAEERCPIAIRSDCRAWLDELAKSTPATLVMIQRDEGDPRPIELEVDGKSQLVAEATVSLELLPGKHTLRFKLPPHAPIEREVSVVLGHKPPLVVVRFPSAAPTGPEPRTIAGTEPRPIPAPVYWYSAGAVVAFAASGALLASALSSRSEARIRCAPECDREASSIRTRLLLADLSGGVGLALTGLAVLSFVRRPAAVSNTSLPRADLQWSLRGSGVAFQSHF